MIYALSSLRLQVAELSVGFDRNRPPTGETLRSNGGASAIMLSKVPRCRGSSDSIYT